MKKQVDESTFFKTHTVSFQKSRASEWQELEKKRNRSKGKVKPFMAYMLGIVAIFLIVLTFVFQFGEKTYKTERGVQKLCTLPDGSTVKMNAETVLKYRPLEWYISRKLKLQGEAFFEVKKGSRFTVHSQTGSTQVLGTSFNVYARIDAYKVSCITGKVQVYTQRQHFNLEPGNAVIWNSETKTLKKTQKEQDALLAWQQGRLRFKAAHLRKVFDELERQYNVYIAYYSGEKRYEYSGNLSLDASLEANLTIICETLDIQWEKSERRDKELYIIND